VERERVENEGLKGFFFQIGIFLGFSEKRNSEAAIGGGRGQPAAVRFVCS
jgi:hypothetical protein